MKKIFALGLVIPAGLAALLAITSCGTSSEDEKTILASLVDNRPVYLFEVSSAHNGDFDTIALVTERDEMDLLATNAYNASYSSLGCTEIHAFISISETDTIRTLGIPAWGTVQGPTGDTIADNLGDLLDGSIDQSLQDAGVTSAAYYWSGSNASGNIYDAVNDRACTGWTTASGSVSGEFGSTSATNALWIATGQSPCGTNYGLLGVCW